LCAGGYGLPPPVGSALSSDCLLRKRIAGLPTLEEQIGHI